MRDPYESQSESALEQLEDTMLTRMWEHARGSEFGPDGIAFNLSFFAPVPREVARGVLRNMRDKGMVRHMTGLWSDDGEPRGAGYALTMKTVNEFQQLESEDD